MTTKIFLTVRSVRWGIISKEESEPPNHSKCIKLDDDVQSSSELPGVDESFPALFSMTMWRQTCTDKKHWVLALALLCTFVKALKEGVNNTLMRFTDGSKLGGVMSTIQEEREYKGA